MKNLLKLAALVAIILAAGSPLRAEQADSLSTKKTYKSTRNWVANGIQDNWDVQITAGVNAQWNGEKMAFGGITADIAVDKWLTPWGGFRLGNKGLAVQNIIDVYIFDGRRYSYNLFYGAGIIRLTNIGAYRTYPSWYVDFYVSLGMVVAVYPQFKTQILAGYGPGFVIGSPTIKDHWHIVADLSFTGCRERYEGTHYSIFPSATIGFSYDFGKRTTWKRKWE